MLDDLQLGRAALARDAAGVKAACERREALGGGRFKRGSSAKACGTLSRHAGYLPGACGELGALYRRGEGRASCGEALKSLAGFPGACASSFLSGPEREACEALTAYRRAFLGRDPLKCGESRFCRALMGAGAELCDDYAQEASHAAACSSAVGKTPCEPSELDRSRLRTADKLLVEAEAYLSDLERWAPPGKAAACRSDFSVGLLRKAFDEDRLGEEASFELYSESAQDLERDYLCRSYAEDDLEVCGELKSFDVVLQREAKAEPIGLDLQCRTLYFEAKMAAALETRGPAFVDLCVRRNRTGDRDFKLDSLETSCGILAQYSGDTAGTCRALGPYFDNATIGGTCPRMLRFAAGDPEVCREFSDPMVRERCAGYAAFHREKREGGGAAACGASHYCRTLLAEAGTCGRYEEGLRETFCGFYASPLGARRFGDLLNRAEAALAQNLAEGRGAEAGKRLMRLRERFAALGLPSPDGR